MRASLEGRGREEETLIYVLLNFEAVCSSSYLEFITLLPYSCGIILYDLKIRFTQIVRSFTLLFTFCGPGIFLRSINRTDRYKVFMYLEKKPSYSLVFGIG